MPKNYKRYLSLLTFLIIIMILMLSSCTPSRQLVYHSKKVEKHQNKIKSLLLEHPELVGQLDTTTIKKSEAFTVNNNIKEPLELETELDTVKFLEKLDEFVELSREVVEAPQMSIATNPAEVQANYKKRIELRDRKIKLLEQLMKGASKDTTFNINDTIKIKGLEDYYIIPLKILLKKKDAEYQLSVIPLIDSLNIYSKIENNIRVDRGKPSLWSWLKDDRTISLAVIVIIFLALLLFKR